VGRARLRIAALARRADHIVIRLGCAFREVIRRFGCVRRQATSIAGFFEGLGANVQRIGAAQMDGGEIHGGGGLWAFAVRKKSLWR